MKAEHVNAFLVPAISVLKKMGKLETKIGKMSKVEQPAPPSAERYLSIIIGLKGDLSGSVILSAPDPVAKAIAGAIVKAPAESVTEQDLNDIMAELANTIVGNATGALYDVGVKAGITPPTVVLGNSVCFRFDAGMDILLIPLITDIGELTMTISLTRI